jgi:DNA invertase Pin-like site-specific DNA recombinase
MATQNQMLPIFTQLPLMAQIAIYTVTASQADDLAGLAHTLGYTQESITIFSDENMAVPLEKRERYQELLTAMKNGSVSVVFLTDAARIFSNATENVLHAFMHLAMAKGIVVITAQMVYDFSNLTSVHQFRLNCTGNSPFLFIVS